MKKLIKNTIFIFLSLNLFNISISDENLEIEKSVFLAKKKIIDSACITISGNLVNKNKTFNWKIRKNI